MAIYPSVNFARLIEFINNAEKILIAVHPNVCSAFFVPVDKELFLQQVKASEYEHMFQIDVRDKILYIDSISYFKPEKSNR